mgnify:FL=1
MVTEQLDDVVMVPTMALMTEDGEHYYVNLPPMTKARKRAA